MFLLPLRLISSLLLALFVSLPASANLSQVLGTDQNPAFLPVHEAFRFSGHIEQDTVIIEARIAPQHYLYKHQFSFTPTAGIQKLGTAVFPVAEQIFDPYYNKNLDIFKHDFKIRIPVTYSGNIPELEISYQGCAEAGLCYPPDKIIIPLVTKANNENPAPQLQTTDKNNFVQQNRKPQFTDCPATFRAGWHRSEPDSLCFAHVPYSFQPDFRNANPEQGQTLALTMTYILAMSSPLRLPAP